MQIRLKPDLFVVHLLTLLEPRAGLRALDAGSGRGRNAVYLTQHGLQVTALDASSGMLKALAGSPVGRVLGRVEALPFARSGFDIVLCTSVLETVPPPVQYAAIAELKRVLAAGGHLLLVTAAPAEPWSRDVSSAQNGAWPPAQADIAEWTRDMRVIELLHLRLVQPIAVGVTAQWALIARR